MQAVRNKALFWCFLALEAAGSQIVLWDGLPIYRRLMTGGTEGAATRDFAMAVLAVGMMQAGHWLAFRLAPKIQFRHHVLVGHMFVCMGELSLFFANALAAVILFDRFADLQFSYFKLVILAAILFAVCCYKHQLATIGEAMIAAQPERYSPKPQAPTM